MCVNVCVWLCVCMCVCVVVLVSLVNMVLCDARADERVRRAVWCEYV
jgi:hypothetical protein